MERDCAGTQPETTAVPETVNRRLTRGIQQREYGTDTAFRPQLETTITPGPLPRR